MTTKPQSNNEPLASAAGVDAAEEGSLTQSKSTPLALNLVTKRTLPPLSNRTSLTLRLSQMSDSGAESCADADEQTRLIRTPSLRAQKFIIIPSNTANSANTAAKDASMPGGSGGGIISGHIRPTISAPALNSSPAVIRMPLNSVNAKEEPATIVTFALEDCEFVADSGVAGSNGTLRITESADALDSRNGKAMATPIATAETRYGNALRNEMQSSSHYLQPKTASITNTNAGGSNDPQNSLFSQIYSDITAVRSLASIGIGSSDGRKLVIKRVPNTPTELFNIVNPPTPPPLEPDDDDDDNETCCSDGTSYFKPRQQHWASKMQFILACVGYSVGLGNVWRFPYMCYKSGGGVFLVPYFIILFVCSIPLLFMELTVGQFTGRGPINALGQLSPLFKGAGLASVVVSFLMSTYSSVIIAYSIYYFFTALKTALPWADCNNKWNSADCWVPQRNGINMSAPNTSRTSSEEFFEYKVLQISPGLEFPGKMRLELFACLVFAWTLVYFSTWKSIRSSAKVRNFTATFPFILILILIARAVTLDGAADGLRYFFRPNWCDLTKANVWINAASQSFNSLGITYGPMITFASYNKYNNRSILSDTISVSVINLVTSILIGIFAFATLGNLALEQNTNVRDVISDGPGFMFIVYPQALAKMPYAQLWSIMFFFMLLCLGLNFQFAIVEVVVTSLQDGFPKWIKRHLCYQEIVVLCVCVVALLLGLPNVMQSGIYYFQLMDHYTASISIMFLAFCQLVGIAWFYGVDRLSKNIEQMTGKQPSFYFKISWLVLGPCLLLAIWILSLINYQTPSYHNGRYKYPDWAYAIGWSFASLSLICLPSYACINVMRADGVTFCQRFKNALHPHVHVCKVCGEHHCEHTYADFVITHELSSLEKSTDTGIASEQNLTPKLNAYKPKQTGDSIYVAENTPVYKAVQTRTP